MSEKQKPIRLQTNATLAPKSYKKSKFCPKTSDAI